MTGGREGYEDGAFRDDRAGAVLSDDRTYRYRLWREWDVDAPTVAFVMLNPSTADETKDDNTIRRCIGYAKDWGYGRLVVGNLFAYRAKKPSELRECDVPIGPENDDQLRSIVEDADRVVAAWGAHGTFQERGLEVERMLDAPLWALGTTQDGQPRHPLFMPSDADLERFSAEVILDE